MADCRWCRRPLPEPVAGIVLPCQYGCASANVAPFVGTCIDCRKPFQTGRPHADQCEACELKEDARYRREADGDATPHTGYTARMTAEGANRRAVAMKKAG